MFFISRLHGHCGELKTEMNSHVHWENIILGKKASKLGLRMFTEWSKQEGLVPWTRVVAMDIDRVDTLMR